MQSRPVCLSCTEVVEYDPVYESPCGHDECPSAVFHGLCLMEFRGSRARFVEFMEKMRTRFVEMFEDHPGMPFPFNPEDEF